ncbi:MAG: DUF3795 domain-containing protein [Candidatus Hodarchaeales archaeon]
MNLAQNVAACGLYCGNCRKLKQGTCPGCPSIEEGKAPGWCKIRPCTIEKGYSTCAECAEWRECKIRDNFMSKLFGFLFRSNKTAMLTYIEKNGLESYAKLMSEQKSMRLPKEH